MSPIACLWTGKFGHPHSMICIRRRSIYSNRCPTSTRVARRAWSPRCYDSLSFCIGSRSRGYVRAEVLDRTKDGTSAIGRRNFYHLTLLQCIFARAPCTAATPARFCSRQGAADPHRTGRVRAWFSASSKFNDPIAPSTPFWSSCVKAKHSSCKHLLYTNGQVEL